MFNYLFLSLPIFRDCDDTCSLSKTWFNFAFSWMVMLFLHAKGLCGLSALSQISHGERCQSPVNIRNYQAVGKIFKSGYVGF